MPPKALTDVYWAARLHDVGKVVVPRAVLKREGSLKPEEFEVIRKHAQAGADIISQASPELRGVALLVLHHHERWDGNGYPTGRREHDIPLGSRVIAVADAFEALTADRPYRKALEPSRALRLIRESSGSHFDPDVVTIFEGRIMRTAAISEPRVMVGVAAQSPEGSAHCRLVDRI